MEKKFLNEDGSLNIKSINKLPYLEYTHILSTMTQAQYKEYITEYTLKLPINEAQSQILPIKVEKRRGVDATEFLREMREKYINNHETIQYN